MVTWRFVFMDKWLQLKNWLLFTRSEYTGKQENNLAASLEKCLDQSFLNVFRSILIFRINGNC